MLNALTDEAQSVKNFLNQPIYLSLHFQGMIYLYLYSKFSLNYNSPQSPTVYCERPILD